MKKMTLLEMTQNILSSMSSDEVNSISDTVESMQVAEEIRNSFYDLYTNRDIAEFESVVNLDTVGDPSRPHLMKVPSNVHHIKWIKYRNFRSNDSAHFNTVKYLDPEEFLHRIVQMHEGSQTPVQEVTLLTTSPLVFPIRVNKAPDYYTVFDNDATLVFDSYDLEHEDFLTSSSAFAWGVLARTFELADDAIPPIDANLFPHLLSDAKSACFINIKEVSNAKEEQRARRQLVRSQTRLVKSRDQREGIFSSDYSRKR